MSSKTTGIASIAEGRSDIHRVDPHKLFIKEGWNTRDQNDELAAHIDMLAQSIAEVGVKEPLTVYWEEGKAYISDGHCRHKAALRAIEHYKAELKTVPCKVEDRWASEAERVLSLIVRNSGKPLSQIEQSRVYKRLIDLGWQQGEIAKKVGLSAARISQILELQALPEPVKDMVSAGTVSAGMAVQTLKQSEGNATKATGELKKAVKAAKAEGRTRALPKDMANGLLPKSATAAFKHAMEYSDVDDSEDEFCVIKMPIEHWNNLRELLKL